MHSLRQMLLLPLFTRCLLSGSCPQFLDATLRAPQHPVEQKGVSVSADLRRDPGSQPSERCGQSLTQAKDPLEARKSDLYVLPHSAPPLGSLGRQKDADLCQGSPQILAAVGQVSQEPPRYPLPQSRRLVDEFLGQADVCDVGRGELVGDSTPIGRPKNVPLHPIAAHGAPPPPPPSRR